MLLIAGFKQICDFCDCLLQLQKNNVVYMPKPPENGRTGIHVEILGKEINKDIEAAVLSFAFY